MTKKLFKHCKFIIKEQCVHTVLYGDVELISLNV